MVLTQSMCLQSKLPHLFIEGGGDCHALTQYGVGLDAVYVRACRANGSLCMRWSIFNLNLRGQSYYYVSLLNMVS